jgi:hypothetical protein
MKASAYTGVGYFGPMFVALSTGSRGTTFWGASFELQKALSEVDDSYINHEFSRKRMKWHFIPPVGPFYDHCVKRENTQKGKVANITNRVLISHQSPIDLCVD